MAEKSIEVPAGEMTIAIIGSSHFLELKTPYRILCELFTCPNPRLSSTIGDGISNPWAGSKLLQRYLTDQLIYRFECQRREHTLQEFTEQSIELSQSAAERLAYVFPTKDKLLGAVTCIEWHDNGDEATVTTYHTFPDELVVVQSHSVIEFTEARSAQ